MSHSVTMHFHCCNRHKQKKLFSARELLDSWFILLQFSILTAVAEFSVGEILSPHGRGVVASAQNTLSAGSLSAELFCSPGKRPGEESMYNVFGRGL